MEDSRNSEIIDMEALSTLPGSQTEFLLKPEEAAALAKCPSTDLYNKDGDLDSTPVKGNGVTINAEIQAVAKAKLSVLYPAHFAAATGKVHNLKALASQEDFDPFKLDLRKRTPLHYACSFGHQEKAFKMVTAILESPALESDDEMKLRLINAQDDKGDCALHFAARIRHTEVVRDLVDNGADLNLKNMHKDEPLQLIFKNVPSALLPSFDDAFECKVGDNNDENLIVNFDTGSIMFSPSEEEAHTLYQVETELLAYCLEHREDKRAAVLLHPAVQTFLHFKWKKIRMLLWVSILYHVIWLLLFTTFVVHTYVLACPHQRIAGGNDTSPGCNIVPHISSLSIELWLLLSVTLTVAVKESYEICASTKFLFYFLQVENIGQWLLIGVVGLSTIPILLRGDDNGFLQIEGWQYQVAAFGIFVAWSLILIQVGKIPRFGIYIEILCKVVKSVTLFMVTFISIIIAFSLSFLILLPEKNEFRDFPWGVLKILSMMVGELNYDDVFYNNDNGDISVPFAASTKALYAVFIAMITVILCNLLIGLAVHDMEGLQNIAQVSSLTVQLEQIYLMEKFVLSHKIQLLLKRLGKLHFLHHFLIAQQAIDAKTHCRSLVVEIHITKIPKHLQDAIRELAKPKPEEIEDWDDEDSSSEFSH